MPGRVPKSMARDLDAYSRLGNLAIQSDAELFRLFRTGGQDGEEAFKAIVHRHKPMVENVCGFFLPNRSDRDEAVQETFKILIGGEIRNPESLKSWLFGVARKVSLRMKGQVTTRIGCEHSYSLSSSSLINHTGGSGCLETLIAEEETAILMAEIQKLPEELSIVVLKFHYEELTYEAIGDQLGISGETVKRRMQKARHVLEIRLRRHGIGPTSIASILAWLPRTAMVQWALTGTIFGIAIKHGAGRFLTLALVLGFIPLLIRGDQSNTILASVRQMSTAYEAFVPLTLRVGERHLAYNVALNANGLAAADLGVIETGANGEFLQHAIYVISLIDSVTGRVLRQIEIPDGINALRFSPDGRMLIVLKSRTAGFDVYDAASARKMISVPVDGAQLDSIALDPGGRRMAVVGAEGLFVYDTQNWKLLHKVPNFTSPVIFSPDGRRLASIIHGRFPALEVYNVSDGTLIYRIELPDVISWDLSSLPLAFSPDGLTLASGHRSGEVILWRAKDGVEISRFKGHDCCISGLIFSPDGRYLASTGSRLFDKNPGNDREIRFSDPRTGQKRFALQSPRYEVKQICFSGYKFAAAAVDRVMIWDLISEMP